MRIKYLFIGVILLLSASVFSLSNIQEKVASVKTENTANRQIGSVCLALARDSITVEELCSIPIPQIPYFYEGYVRIKELDEEWFLSKGWLYYPQVSCVDNNVTFIAEVDATASVGMIGKNIKGSGGTASTRLGKSGFILNGASISASAALPFRVIGLAEQTKIQDGILGPASTDKLVEVKLNNGAFNTTTGI